MRRLNFIDKAIFSDSLWMCKIFNSILLILATIHFLVLCAFSLCHAQSQLDGIIEAGSIGNTATITVTNPDETLSIENVSLSLSNEPRWITNISIDADSNNALAPGGSRKYTIKFNVSENAEPDDIDKMEFELLADGILVDIPNPKMTLKIIRPSDSKVSGAPVLKLVELVGPKPGKNTIDPWAYHVDVSYKKGDIGMSWKSIYEHYRPHMLGAFRLTKAPLEIILGQPFEFSAELKVRTIFKNQRSCFEKGRLDRSHQAKRFANMYIASQYLGGPISLAAIGKSDLYLYCKSQDKSKLGESVADVPVEKEDTVALRILFSPTKIEIDKGYTKLKRIYYYSVNFITKAKLRHSQIEENIPKTYKIEFRGKITDTGFLHPDEKPTTSKHQSPFILIAGHNFRPTLSLYYDAIHEGNPHIRSLPEYHWPPELQRPPRDEQGSSDDAATDEDGEEIEPDGIDGTEPEETIPEAIESDSVGPIDPNTLDPHRPKVANHIKQWTSTAKPPENAVPGSNYRYDPFGRVVGSGPGMRTIDSRTHDSVQYARGTPQATAWSLRKKLDSIDHCTLEEYVVAKLEQKPINHCIGRYGAVKDLKGMKLSAAKTAVTAAGFKYDGPVAGTPAKTAEVEGTIERQEPGPDQYLKKGQVLKLVVHTAYVTEKLTLPDFIGESLRDAKKWLKKNKLKMKQPRAGSPAPTKKKSRKIQAQEPAAGTVMKEGDAVLFTVHTPYVPGQLALPNFVGKSLRKAKKWLDNNKLKMQRPKAGSPAPKKEKSGTIEAQEPVAGTVMKSGGKVTFTVHSKYVDARRVPKVVEFSAGKAKELIENAGLKADPKPTAKKPSSREQAKTVARQSPAAGTSVPPGTKVTIYVYGPFLNTVTVPNVRKLLYKEAKRRLEAVGLSMSKQVAGRPGIRSLTNTAQKQEPVSGTEVSKGQTVSVWFYGQYVPSREEQVANTNCYSLSGSRAYWDNNAGQPKCGCFDGLRWNLNKSACISQHDFAWEWCARNRPGSYPKRKSDGSYQCLCPSGYILGNNNRCVRQRQLTPEEICAKSYPGSAPTGRNANGIVNCDCPQGFKWVSNPKRCVRQHADRPSCSCKVDMSLMIRLDGFCTTFAESRDQQGRLDPHGTIRIVHIVHEDQFTHGWRVPKGWLKGRYNTCEILLKDSEDGCARYCR